VNRQPLKNPPRSRRHGCRLLVLSAVLLAAGPGCAATGVREAAPVRTFDFDQDTFSYVNELDWEYRIDPATGRTTSVRNEPKPEFSRRCFAVSHMARQFFRYARFDPASPPMSEESYRRDIDMVISRSPAEGRRAGKVVIPGYANLRSFSRDREALLKDASGGYLHSLFQWSNWRMVFPFSRGHQQATAQHLLDQVAGHRLPIVHLIRFSPFPITAIDHVVVVYGAAENAGQIRFRIYDPNYSDRPGLLSFDRGSRTFVFPTTKYFADGPIDVYEIYDDEL